MTPSPAERLRGLGPAAFVALVTSLPFLPGLLQGRSLYFRDLCRHFFPLRLFVVEGLRRGEVRYWNPLVNEGTPLSLPPVSYPLDILQAVAPNPWGLSLLLALHVPLAGIALMRLARSLGIAPPAAAAGGIVYALGGFALSTVNLYVHVQALAWAPLLVLGLIRAAEGGPRELAAAAVITAISLSTTGVEIVLQAFVVGLVLSAARPLGRRWLKALLAGVLGAGLVAPTLIHLANLVGESTRRSGFGSDVVMSHSVHPLTFLQVVVGGLYGDLSNLAGRFWGSNFFPRGFPYFLSLYLGLTVVVLAILGSLWGKERKTRLLLLLLLLAASVLALGRWAGLGVLTDAIAALRKFRYPSKAFFTAHLAVALLAAMGLDALVGPKGRRAWLLCTILCMILGSLLLAAPAIPSFLPRAALWFLRGFFPPEQALQVRLGELRYILSDASLGGLAAVVAGLLSLAVLKKWVAPATGVLALAGLLTADLLREGVGLNPMVTRTFFQLSPEMAEQVARWRQDDHRVFTCDPASASAYFQARALLGDRHEVWSFAILSETLSPGFNIGLGVATAMGPDLTMLVPEERTLPETACHTLDTTLPLLRRAGVGHVLSLDPLFHPDLVLESVIRPARIAPLAIHAYSLSRPPSAVFTARTVSPAHTQAEAQALAAEEGRVESGSVVLEEPVPIANGDGRIVAAVETPGRIELTVEAPGPALVVVREAYDAAWTARVDGLTRKVRRADGRHLAVEVPNGSGRVVLRYRPGSLGLGIGVMCFSVLAVVALWWTGRRKTSSRGLTPVAATE